jgi:hypothetical protein
MEHRMNPPVTTSKGVRIGSAYVPPPAPIRSTDALQLQRALLDPRTAKRTTWVQRIIRGVIAWL